MAAERILGGSIAGPVAATRRLWRAPGAGPLLVLVPFVALLALKPILPEAGIVWPKSIAVPFIDWINVVVNVFHKHEIFGVFTVKDATRAIAFGIEWPLDIVHGLLEGGFRSIGIPAIPWVMIAGLAAVFGWWLKGWRLALLAGGCIVYFAVFGKWSLSMTTLSVVLVAAPIAAAVGVALGVVAVKWPPFERVLWPILNVMQSLPHFSYLIPVALFIGVSHRAGAIATILFAIPPMARLTVLGLKGVSDEVREAGRMAGCTRWQMLFKVEIPAARDSLMLGVNQVIMQCLAMVVIASFVGAKGLGQDLLFRLQSLRLGQALENGVAVVLMAVMLDRLSRALSEKQPERRPEGPFWRVHPYLCAAGLVIAASIVASQLTPYAQTLPKNATITTAPFWDMVVDAVTFALYDPLSIIRDGLLVHVLIPLRTGFQWMPWIAVAALAGAIGWRLAGFRLSATVAGFVAFIALTGFWERASITAYMVFFALILCLIFGLPLGIWASKTARRTRFVQLLCDTFQTFPSFIYLIPVIMLFQVGDVAAITAIVIYAAIPIVRYTIFGLRGVPNETIEAAITAGCTPRQILWKVRMPLAFPEIMLGVNQTIMFGLFMVIIAAFIGTKDLGQEIFRALTFADAGKGLVIGLCVAFIGLTVDRLVVEWSEQRRRQLGLA